MKHEVRYRLEVDYLWKEHADAACMVSSPIYTKAEGLARYKEECKKPCIDRPERPARVHLWRYAWDENGKCNPVTICKNY